jgi:hypothetical protein
LRNSQVANIYATFELRKFIGNYFFRGKIPEVLVVAGGLVTMTPNGSFPQWYDK